MSARDSCLCGQDKKKEAERCLDCYRVLQRSTPMADLSYRGQHHRVEVIRGKASEHTCSVCHVEPAKEWANIGDYAEIDDYVPMCVSCHRTYDESRNTHCKNGHEWTEETTYRRPDTGHRQCLLCSYERQGLEWKRSCLCGEEVDKDDYIHLLEDRLRSVLGSRNHPGWLTLGEKEWYRSVGGDPI